MSIPIEEGRRSCSPLYETAQVRESPVETVSSILPSGDLSPKSRADADNPVQKTRIVNADKICLAFIYLLFLGGDYSIQGHFPDKSAFAASIPSLMLFQQSLLMM